MDRRKFFGSFLGAVATLIALPLSFDYSKRNRCQEITDKFLAGLKEESRKASLRKNVLSPPSWRTPPNLPRYVQNSYEDRLHACRDIARKQMYETLDKS